MAEGKYSLSDAQPVQGTGKYSLDQAQAIEEPESAASSFIKGAASKLNPLNMLKGVEDTVKAIREAPIDTAKEIFLHPYMAASRAVDAIKAGDVHAALGHLQSALEPANFGTEGSLVKLNTPGQRAEGAGELAGTGALAYLGAKAPDIATGTANAVKSGVGAVADATKSLDPDIVGLVSPRAAHLLRVARKVGDLKARPLDTAAPANSTEQMISPTAGSPNIAGSPASDAAMSGVPQASASAPAGPVPINPSPDSITPQLLDDIAKGMGGKKFSQLGPAGQEAVTMMAKRVSQAQNPPPVPAAAAVSPPASEVAIPPAGQPAETSMAVPFYRSNANSEFSPGKGYWGTSDLKYAENMGGTVQEVPSPGGKTINMSKPGGYTPQEAVSVLKKNFPGATEKEIDSLIDLDQYVDGDRQHYDIPDLIHATNEQPGNVLNALMNRHGVSALEFLEGQGNDIAYEGHRPNSVSKTYYIAPQKTSMAVPSPVKIAEDPTAGSDVSNLLDKLKSETARIEPFAPDVHKSPVTVARQLEGKGTMAEGAPKGASIPNPSANQKALDISQQLKDLLDGKSQPAAPDLSTIKISPAYLEMLKKNPKAAQAALKLAAEMAK